MITMTERGGFCFITAPTYAAFNEEVRKLIPRAQIDTPEGQHTSQIRIPSRFRQEMTLLVNKYYTLDGDVRRYVKPDWDDVYPETPEPPGGPAYYDAQERWRESWQSGYRRPQESLWEAVERAREAVNDTQEFTRQWERVKEAYWQTQPTQGWNGQQWSPPPYTRPGQYASPVDITTTAAYRMLGVMPGANHVVIRAAYRALAGIYHPDKPGGSTEKMQQLNTAFDAVKKIERMAS
jgi:DnaJ-domain-containing protein 1